MTDWPITLKRNVAVIELAQALQRARADYYELPHFELNELPARARDRYIVAAHELLQRLAPEPRQTDLASQVFQMGVSMNRVIATGLHRADGVIGVIEPKEQRHDIDGNR